MIPHPHRSTNSYFSIFVFFFPDMAPHSLSAHNSPRNRAESLYPHGDPSWGVEGRKAQGQKPTAKFGLGQNDNTVTNCVSHRHSGSGGTHQEGKNGNSGWFPSRTAAATRLFCPTAQKKSGTIPLGFRGWGNISYRLIRAVIYLGRHPPNPHTLGPSTTQIWIGGLLYVDDPALMSTCPRELQAMLHVCQQWSIRNRMQINTDKTKIMAFFETPALLRARGGQYQPGPTMPLFHVYSPFPTSDPRSYPIHEVFQFS